MKVVPIRLSDVKQFIETNHYSKSINGCKVSQCFALIDEERGLVGAAMFGSLSTTAWKKYGDNEADVVELRRLVTLDDLPKNTLSWFVSKTLKYLKTNTSYKVCISYADPHHGHVGYVYQATNWNYLGQTPGDTVLETPDGSQYHSRAMRTKYKGKLKPFAKKLQDMDKQGLLKSVNIPGKHIYKFNLKGKQDKSKLEYPKL